MVIRKEAGSCNDGWGREEGKIMGVCVGGGHGEERGRGQWFLLLKGQIKNHFISGPGNYKEVTMTV